jgi:hypothetical protein
MTPAHLAVPSAIPVSWRTIEAAARHDQPQAVRRRPYLPI